jgi:hypothetical protein
MKNSDAKSLKCSRHNGRVKNIIRQNEKKWLALVKAEWNVRGYNMQGISGLAEEMLVCREELYCMELVK